MSRVAVFIDAGYFWVQAIHIVFGARGPRTSLTIDYAVLHKKVLDEVAAQFPGKDLLRVYWYDGPDSNGSKGPDHLAIDQLDDFKLRLGTRNVTGQQKAVDGMIISDLLTFAQSRAIENAILITGDADLTPGVVSAQALGMRVHLVIIGPPASTSPYLVAEADKKVVWDSSVVASFAKPAATTVIPPAAVMTHSATPSLAQNSKPSTSTVESLSQALTTKPSVAGSLTHVDDKSPSYDTPVQVEPQTTAALPTPTATADTKANVEAPASTAQEASDAGSDTSPANSSSASIATLVDADFGSIAEKAHAKIKAGTAASLLATASPGSHPLHKVLDRAVLRVAAAHAGRMLSEPEKRQARIAFKALL